LAACGGNSANDAAVGGNDLAVASDDLGAGNDLSDDDLSSAPVPDLAVPRDLAGYDFAGVDLAVPRDLTVPHDFAHPPIDLAGADLAGSMEIFPPDNPWNTDISNDPVDPNSDNYIASIGASVGLHPDFDSIGDGIPYVDVPPTQLKVPVTFTSYPGESDPGPYPIPDNAPIEGGGDAHVIVVDRLNGYLYELYQGMKVASGWSAANGAVFNLRSNALRPAGWTSADAAGLPIFPGLVRYDEVTAGLIPHALRFTIAQTQKGYVSPARHAAGSCAYGSNCPPMGLRVRLKSSVVITTYPPSVQVILTALKKYGMFVADNSGGSNWYISGEPNASWNDSDLHKINGIIGSDFEVVQSGPITAYP
jgi:hypothetical protein